MSTHPVICPCTWEGAPQPTPSKAREKLRMHRLGRACPESPNYVPREEREAARRAKQADAGRRRAGMTLGSRTTCTIADGDCTCPGCRLAAKDKASPLDLGGQWVKRGAVRVWVA